MFYTKIQQKIQSRFHSLDSSLDLGVVHCDCCANLVEIGQVKAGEEVICPHCDFRLIRIEESPFVSPLIYLFLTLLFAFIGAMGFFLAIDSHSGGSFIYLSSFTNKLFSLNYPLFAIIVFLFLMINPLIFILSILHVYLCLIFNKKIFNISLSASFIKFLRPWIMLDIFFISTLVSLVKIRVYGHLEYGVAFFALFVCSIFLARTALSVSDFWVKEKLKEIDTRPLKSLKKELIYSKKMIHISWALLLTSVILYFPASLLPMMTTSIATQKISSNLLDGIIILWQSKDYLVASIIFIASFLVPLLKIILLSIILISISFKPILSKKILSKSYHAIERMGRWSMVDIFVIIILISLFNKFSLIQVIPGEAVIYFFLVVVLTMIATSIVDSRLIWQKFSDEE